MFSGDEYWSEDADADLAGKPHDPLCGVEGVYCADCLADQADRVDAEREEQL